MFLNYLSTFWGAVHCEASRFVMQVWLKQALEINRDIGYKQGEANNLGNIGLIYFAKGNPDEALKYHQESLEINRDIKYKLREANNLGNIGIIYWSKGNPDEALKYLEQALSIFESIGAEP